QAAVKHDINLITRVVDYGGMFHDDVKPGHRFGQQDHRTFRPAGWVEAGCAKLDQLRPIAKKHNVTLIQLACLWNLAQPGVKSVIPTLIQEVGENTKTVEAKTIELASLPEIRLSDEEVREIARIGDNRGCMELKGAHRGHVGEPLPDRWAP